MDSLTYLGYALNYFQNLDIPCRLDRATSRYPVDMLVLPLEGPGYPEEGATMSVFFARPDAAFCRELQMQILHLIAYLGRVEEDAAEELRRYFGSINSQLPLGSFDVDGEGNFTFRYTLPMPDETTPEVFLRQLSCAHPVMNAVLLMFLHPALDVKEGRATAREALARMEKDVAAVANAISGALKGEKVDGNQ